MPIRRPASEPSEVTQVILAERPEGRALWSWLVVLCVLALAGLAGALLAVRDNSRRNTPATATALTVAPAPRSAANAPVDHRGISRSTATLTVPDVRGERFPDARKTIRGLGLVAEVSRVSSSLPKQSVVTQSPASGASAVRGDHVLLTVSVGSEDEKGNGRHRGQHKQKKGTTWESE
jgi:hypothetical protein